MAPVDVCILKTEEGLSLSLSRLEAFKAEALAGAGAADPHYLVKLTEARSMTLLTEMYRRASLLRRESRSGHYRADHPQRDDARGPAWIEIRRRPEGMDLNFRPVPLERYPVRPYRYYMDNFAFPDPASTGTFSL